MQKSSITLITLLLIFFISCSSDSEVPQLPDTVGPTLAFSIPGLPNIDSGETMVVGNQITINVEANDDGGIAIIEVFINEDKVGEDLTPPYSITIDLSSYDAKTDKSDTFVNHTLKIRAIDLAGNTSTVEQEIQIDRDIPTITALSLEEGAILSGNSNLVSFDVADNEGLSSVLVFLNNEEFAEILNETYEVNIDTSILLDGENILKIEVRDTAGNLASISIGFIVDNTGPNLILDSLEDDQIVDQAVNLTPTVEDDFSTVSLVEIFYGEDLIYSTSDISDINYLFDPENFPVGNATLKIKAHDELGNISQLILNINILRLLLKISIPDDYLSPNITANHFVFASEHGGALIGLKEIFFETREIRIHAPEEFEQNENFTVTFASLGQNGVSSYLYSIFNLNRLQPEQLSFEAPKRFTGESETSYPISGFSESTQLSSVGRDYYFTSSQLGNTLLQTLVPTNHNFGSESVYIYGFNPSNSSYSYQFVNKPIAPDYEINATNFTTDNVVSKQFTTTPANYASNSRSLILYGFSDQEGLDIDLYHQIWEYGFGQSPATAFDYNLNTLFFEYGHNMNLGNYHSQGIGLPEDNIQIPDWHIDYTFQNNNISLIKSGMGHTIGEIFLEDGYGIGVPYQWNLVFDSNDNNEIILPVVPPELDNFPFYNQYQNDNLEVKRVGLLKYDGVNSYNDYLENIVKPNKAFGKSSPRFVSIFAGDAYYSFSNSDYFFNWW